MRDRERELALGRVWLGPSCFVEAFGLDEGVEVGVVIGRRAWFLSRDEGGGVETLAVCSLFSSSDGFVHFEV